MCDKISYYDCHLEDKRWVILGVFSIFTFTNASAFVTYSPIVENAARYYHCSQSDVLWLANSWYISYVFLAIPALFFFRWRLGFSLKLGTLLNAVGGWIRYVGDDSYSYALTGQIVLSMAQLFILPAPVIIAERWFGSAERLTATGIMLFSNVLGLSFGFLTSVYYVNQPAHIPNYIFYMAVCLSLSFLPGLFIFHDQPA